MGRGHYHYHYAVRLRGQSLPGGCREQYAWQQYGSANILPYLQLQRIHVHNYNAAERTCISTGVVYAVCA